MEKLTNFRILTRRPKRLKTELKSGFKAHQPSLQGTALDPQAHGFAAVASDPSHKPFGYAAARYLQVLIIGAGVKKSKVLLRISALLTVF